MPIARRTCSWRGSKRAATAWSPCRTTTTDRHWVRSGRCGDEACWQLAAPLAYFIPEHAIDPSRQPGGASLWAEVTLPPTGAPRPIRLGVQKGATIEPIAP